jgi:hypothetical protein
MATTHTNLKKTENTGFPSETSMNYAFDRVKDFAGPYVDRAKVLSKDVSEKIQSGVKDMPVLVRRYPVQSLLIGFGVGIAISMLLRRRNLSFE